MVYKLFTRHALKITHKTCSSNFANSSKLVTYPKIMSNHFNVNFSRTGAILY